MNEIPITTLEQGWQRVAGQYRGAVKVAFLMQIRQWGVWYIFGGATLVCGLLLVTSAIGDIGSWRDSQEALTLLLTRQQMQFSSWILALITGLLVADSIPRDRILKMIEMYTSTLPRFGGYVLGKYCGNLLVMCGGALLMIMFDGVALVAAGAPLQLLPQLLLAFWCLLLPVLLLIVAFVFMISCIFSAKVVYILFPVVWLYCTYTPLKMATPANTILAPDGRYALEVFFGLNRQLGLPTVHTLTEVWMNIALLLGITAICLFITHGLVFTPLRRRHSSVSEQAPLDIRRLIHKELAPRRLQHIREHLSLWSYHFRVTHPFLLQSLLGGATITCLLLVLIVHNGNGEHSREFACYILESGTALVAGILTSSTLMSDPAREMLVCTRLGAKRIVCWRIMLSLLWLACAAICFLLLSLVLHIQYSTHDTLPLLFALWLIPSFLASMIGLLGAMLTRSSALGSALVGFFLLLPHFAREMIMKSPILQLFCIPLTLFDPNTHLWWWNRLTLLAVGLLLLLATLWLMRRDELLVETQA